MTEERYPLLIGDIAIEEVRNGNVRLRSGGDGRLRVVVPAEDRAAVAAAVAPPGSVVVPRGREDGAISVAAEMHALLEGHGQTNGNFLLIGPDDLRRWIDRLDPLPEETAR